MKRNAREAELAAATASAFRLGGMEAVYTLSVERRRSLPCPLCEGGKVVKFYAVMTYAATATWSPGQPRVEECGGCSGIGKVRPTFARAQLQLAEEMIATLNRR